MSEVFQPKMLSTNADLSSLGRTFAVFERGNSSEKKLFVIICLLTLPFALVQMVSKQ